MRAVCYPRVSSVQQRDRDSIASQLRELPAFVARMGWTLVKPVDAYVDDGFSAKSGRLEKRRGLRGLLRDAAAGAFDVVVMVDFNRLTRAEDLAERGMILGALQAAGVRVATTSGELLDLNTEHGDLIASLMGARAAAENRAIRDGKLTSALRGGKPTGRDPYGHRFDRATKTWLVDEQRAPFVRELFERIAAGESCIAIACDFERRGVPSSAKAWNKALVRYIARSTRPIGEYVAHRKSRTVVKVPALVDVALWQRVQDALTNARRNGLRRTKYIYLLERLAVCGLCGAKMRIRTKVIARGKWIRPAAYVCERRLPHLPVALRDPSEPKCSGFMYVEEADALAWEAIVGELSDPALPAELAAERTDIASDARTYEDDAAGYRAHLARLDKVDEVVWTRFRRGDINEAALDRELAKTRRERAAVSAQLKHAERARGATINARARLHGASAMIERMKAKANAATPAERREIALTMLDPGDVVFRGDGAIELRLAIDRPATTRESSDSMAVDSLLTDDPESRLLIRVVTRRAG
jgi:DNA invertase Pin-like site-specific DNA recombinase